MGQRPSPDPAPRDVPNAPAPAIFTASGAISDMHASLAIIGIFTIPFGKN
jgi:hypothetical protein